MMLGALVAKPLWELTSGSELQAVEREFVGQRITQIRTKAKKLIWFGNQIGRVYGYLMIISSD